jgi:hypothetical protein
MPRPREPEKASGSRLRVAVRAQRPGGKGKCSIIEESAWRPGTRLAGGQRVAAAGKPVAAGIT